LLADLFEAVRLSERLLMPDEKPLQRFLRCLLAVKDDVVDKRRYRLQIVPMPPEGPSQPS
jgi:hypothetical protein